MNPKSRITRLLARPRLLGVLISAVHLARPDDWDEARVSALREHLAGLAR